MKPDEGSTEDPDKIMLPMPSLSLSSPLGLVMWSATRANWQLRCSRKFEPRHSPPHWNHFLNLWIAGLETWMEHPTPTLPHSEVQMLLHGVKQLSGPEGLLDYSRADAWSPPAPTLLYPHRKKPKKQGHEEQLHQYFEDVIERYEREGWQIVCPDGSSEN